jgi:hypothetical protein
VVDIRNMIEEETDKMEQQDPNEESFKYKKYLNNFNSTSTGGAATGENT